MPITKSLSTAISDGVGNYNFRNRIINGDMRIDQRNNGASVTPASGTASYITDRFSVLGTQSSKFTAQQNAGSVTPPPGFSNYLGITSSSSYSSISSDLFRIFHTIEGYNIVDFAWGTSNAKPVTMSFWVRSSLTGTFGGCFQNQTNNRAYAFTYTISASNTWEYKTITISGETSGTWYTNNTLGLAINFDLGSGSSKKITPGSWQTVDANAATGCVSIVGTNGATFYITGLQLEVGTAETPFERRPYATELALCQRYCEKANFSYMTAGYKGGGYAFKVSKRATPTMTFWAGNDFAGTSGSLTENNSSGSAYAVSAYQATVDCLQTLNISTVSITATITGSFLASAEL